MPGANNEAPTGTTETTEAPSLLPPVTNQLAPVVSDEELNSKMEEGLQNKIRYWSDYQRYFFEKDQYRDDFELRLWKYYILRQNGIIEKENEYIGKMEGTEKENYIEKYLRNYYLYRQYTNKSEGLDINESNGFFKRDSYPYETLENSNVELKPYNTLDANSRKLSAKKLDEILEKFNFQEGMILNLINNGFGDEGFKNLMKKFSTIPSGATLNLWLNDIGSERKDDIPEITIGEGASLDLQGNKIGSEWVKALSKKLKLKVGANISFCDNNIGDAGAEAIAELDLDYGVSINLSNNKITDKGIEDIANGLNSKFKEGVCLDFSNNNIGDDGADAIMNMELKSGMHINLSGNNITKDKKDELQKKEETYHNKGIMCRISVN